MFSFLVSFLIVGFLMLLLLLFASSLSDYLLLCALVSYPQSVHSICTPVFPLVFNYAPLLCNTVFPSFSSWLLVCVWIVFQSFFFFLLLYIWLSYESREFFLCVSLARTEKLDHVIYILDLLSTDSEVKKFITKKYNNVEWKYVRLRWSPRISKNELFCFNDCTDTGMNIWAICGPPLQFSVSHIWPWLHWWLIRPRCQVCRDHSYCKTTFGSHICRFCNWENLKALL